MNKAILIGYVGNDPDMKRVGDGGSKLVKLRLATTERWKDKAGEKMEKTQWHQLIFWGKLAEVVDQYVKKGMRLAVVGKIEYGQYESKKTGNTVYTTEINCTEMEMLSRVDPLNAASKPEESDDDLPF